DRAVELASVTKVSEGDFANALRRDARFREPPVEGKTRQNAKLVAGVDTIDVKSRISLRVTGLLGLRERLLETNAVALHLRQDVIRSAVQHAINGQQTVSSHAVADRSQHRHSTGYGSFHADGKISFCS